MRNRAFDEPMDGIVYGVVASLGFATLENILFVFNGGMSVAVSRAFTAVPLHAFVGAIMGYYVGQAWRHPEERRRFILQGYGIAVLAPYALRFPADGNGRSGGGRDGPSPRPVHPRCSHGLLVVDGQAGAAPAQGAARCSWSLPPARKRISVASDPTGSPVPPAEGERTGTTVPVVPPAMRSQQVRIRQRIAGIAICLVGGVVASFGGMVTLGLMLAFMIGVVQPIHTVDVAIGGVVSGVAPLVIGVVVFRKGVKGMNQKK